MYAVSFLSFWVLIKCSLVLIGILSLIFMGLDSHVQRVLTFGLTDTIRASEMVPFFYSRTGISPLVMYSGIVTVR